MSQEQTKPYPTGFATPAVLVDMKSVQAKQMALIDSMIMWQFNNPGKPWTHCAAQLGVSTLWCRMMANSDAYRARYAEQSDKLLHDVGMFTLRQKIEAAAEVVVERIAEKALVAESMTELGDMADTLLTHHFGVTPVQPQAPTLTLQQQIIVESRAAIVAPREPQLPQGETK